MNSIANCRVMLARVGVGVGMLVGKGVGVAVGKGVGVAVGKDVGVAVGKGVGVGRAVIVICWVPAVQLWLGDSSAVMVGVPAWCLCNRK